MKRKKKMGEETRRENLRHRTYGYGEIGHRFLVLPEQNGNYSDKTPRKGGEGKNLSREGRSARGHGGSLCMASFLLPSRGHSWSSPLPGKLPSFFRFLSLICFVLDD